MSRAAVACSLFIISLVAACDREDRPLPAPPPTSNGMSAVARSYVDSIVNLMQRLSINRKRIDWSDFRVKTLAAAPRAPTIRDTHPAIVTALGLLADGHSQYRGSDGTFLFVPLRTCAGVPATDPNVPLRIGYVRVPAFGGAGQDATNFAADLQATIRLRDRDDLHGWIVDLRGNGGGNMWPMIAGVGPVLGEGLNGAFIDPDSVTQGWSYAGGASRIGGQAVVSLATPYDLTQPAPRVAVLIDGRVASSGEATAIAFKGRSNTRFFGTPTCGLSTANAAFPLPDGALLVLTTSVMADRHRTLYGAEVPPDELFTAPEAAVARAIAWIETGR